MRGVRYYRIMIALPALGSLLAVLLVALFWKQGFMYALIALLFAGMGDAEAEDAVGVVLLLALLSPVTLGCLVASPLLLRRLRDQPEAAYERMARRAPIWVGAATFLASSALFLVAFDFNPDVIVLGLIVGVFTLIAGYVYVGLAATLLRILRKFSLVEALDGS
jgi:hypothetical protein